MGQPRKLRGDRRRHASPVKLFTQAKTTGSLIQRLSRRGTATTNAEPARTNVAKSTNLQHQEHGRRVYVDPGASWRALTRQSRSSATKSCPPFPTAGALAVATASAPQARRCGSVEYRSDVGAGAGQPCPLSAGWRIRAQCRTAARKPSEPDANTTHFPRRSRPCSNRNSPRAALCRRPTVSRDRISSAINLSVNAHKSSSRHQLALVAGPTSAPAVETQQCCGARRPTMLDHATFRTRRLLPGRAPRVIRVVLPVARSIPHDALVAAGVLSSGVLVLERAAARLVWAAITASRASSESAHRSP
jgi:hypothetical protein